MARLPAIVGETMKVSVKQKTPSNESLIIGNFEVCFIVSEGSSANLAKSDTTALLRNQAAVAAKQTLTARNAGRIGANAPWKQQAAEVDKHTRLQDRNTAKNKMKNKSGALTRSQSQKKLILDSDEEKDNDR